MARLTIDMGEGAEMVFHFATVRTQEFTVEPVMDPSGVHYECSKITLDVVAVVNAVTFATNKRDPKGVGLLAGGDRMPLTLRNVRDALMHPRRKITFGMGDDAVIQLPGLTGNGPAICDARCGPFPVRASFTPVTGDKSAVLSYRVICYDNYASQYALSHGWSLSSSIDRYGWTTRTITGRVCFRRDLLHAINAVPDDFRAALFVPTPGRMRRVGVDVVQHGNGYEYEYTVTDRQVEVGLGAASPALEVTGSVTSAVTAPVKTLKQFAGVISDIATHGYNFEFAGLAKTVVGNSVPVNTNVGVCRAVGRPGSDRRYLSALAQGFLLDRFGRLLKGWEPEPNGPLVRFRDQNKAAIDRAEQAARLAGQFRDGVNALANRLGVLGVGVFGLQLAANIVGQAADAREAFRQLPGGAIVHLACTHSISSDENPWAEVRMEVMGYSQGSIDRTLAFDPNAMLNLDSQYDAMNQQLAKIPMKMARFDVDAPQLAADNNSRGDILTALLTQALSPPTPLAKPQTPSVPQTPPDNRGAFGFRDLK